MAKIIDLRSDTVTKPSDAMREYMLKARVGDDVYEEDPTINELQQKLANLCHKDAGLFVPSGTMSNQLAIKSHTQPGNEVICDINSHIFNYEAAGPSLLSGVQIMPLHGNNGILTADQVINAIRPDNIHAPKTALIEIENTHNRAGGTIYPIDTIQAIREVSLKHNIPLHIDGARLFNASVATGIPIQKYTELADSISICFSKGLGTPVGSVLLGNKEFIDKARRYRKIFGGGMRQAGILAAACIYALDNNIERLAVDHKNARILAENIQKLPGLRIEMEKLQTNILMVYVEHPNFTPDKLVGKLKENNILVNAVDSLRIRIVTHLDVTENDMQITSAVFKSILS